MEDLQALCELGQRQLMEMHYHDAERTLVHAEQIAITQRDAQTLSRLYLPLQETRRQRRQRSGEGIVQLDIIAQNATDSLDAAAIIEQYPHGQLLIAGWVSIQPAINFRRLQHEQNLFVETFLAAAYPVGDSKAIAIVPSPDMSLPDASPRSIDELLRLLPPHAIVLPENQLPTGPRPGTWQTYGEVMSLWERLSSPSLAQADALPNSWQKIDAYRRTIQIDYANELAHQNLAATAAQLAANNIRSNEAFI